MRSKHLREGLVLCKRLSEVYPQKIALVSSTEPLTLILLTSQRISRLRQADERFE